MSERTTLEEALKERLDIKKLIRNDNQNIGGGCISKCLSYTIDDDKSIFVKTNSSLDSFVMFNGEFESLRQICSTNTIKCPKPKLVLNNYDSNDSSAIVMDYFNMTSLTNDCAKKLGHNLANLHDYNNKVIRFNRKASSWVGRKIPSVKKQVGKNDKTNDSSEDSDEEDDYEEDQFTKHCMKIKNIVISKETTTKKSTKDTDYPERFVPEPNTEEVLKFGFDVPTSCGSIPQVNEWSEDWISFYARHRLDKAIREILSDRGDRELSQQWSQLQLKVDKFFTSDFPLNNNHENNNKIIPSLLHGDLWSGNVAQTATSNNNGAQSFDPIIYDPSSFYGHSEYEFGIARMFGGIPRAFEDSYFELIPKKKLFEKRNKLYQLFHHLNHWSHFGSGYRASSLRLIKDLNNMI